MVGLRRRVTFGFMGIVGVLILSGMISFFELSTLSNDTDKILDANRRNGELANEMLSAVREQSSAFVRMTAFSDRKADAVNARALDRIDLSLLVARDESFMPEVLDSMIVTANEMRKLSDKFTSVPYVDSNYELLKSEFPQLDSLSKSFAKSCYEEYLPIHDRLIVAIDRYRILLQNSLAPGAEQLHHNAYRTVTPVFISLLVMIILVLMLFYFIMLYCVSPIVTINRALKDYLAFKIPFSPKGQNKDEIDELCDRINILIKQSKTSNKEEL